MAQDYFFSVKRLFSVLTEPGRVFKTVLEKPGYIGPALVIFAINVLLAAVLLPKARAATLWMVEHAAVAMQPDVKALLPVMVTVATLLGAMVTPLVVWLVVAYLLKYYGNRLKNEQPLRTLLTVAVYGYLPILIGNLVATVIAVNTPVENFRRVTVSIAMFLPCTKTFTYALLTRFNPFTWWSIVLWSIGGSLVFNRRPLNLGVYLFGLWLLYSLLFTFFFYAALA